MSADNIATCPRCGEGALREWYGIYIEHDDPVGRLRAEYECSCWECGFEWAHEFAPVPISPDEVVERFDSVPRG